MRKKLLQHKSSAYPKNKKFPSRVVPKIQMAGVFKKMGMRPFVIPIDNFLP
jgi:hypothetical protein